MPDREREADAAAERMADEHEARQADLLDDLFEIVREAADHVRRAGRVPVAVPEAGVVDRDHVVALGELGRDLGPVVPEARLPVQQHDGRGVGSGPFHVVDLSAVDGDHVVHVVSILNRS